MPLAINSSFFEDETYLNVIEDFLLLEIKEENVPLSKENFDIETSLKDDNYEGPKYLNRKWIYESPDGGKTIYRREEGNYDRKKEKIKSL